MTAIASFTESISSYPDTIARAISMGGDTDTLAAMAGALSGAHLGKHAPPPNLLDLLEDGHKGKTYIRDLAHSLHGLHQQLITYTDRD